MNLPPFIDLLAFDAAARHGTFTRAAQELGISQPAISRRVAALEVNLGVKLFLRDTRPLTLTETGQRLFEVLHSGLSRLDALVKDIRSKVSDNVITLTAGSGFSSFWLLPRLPSLCAAFPQYNLRIMSGDRAYDAGEGELHIRFGDGNWPGQQSLKILGEEVYAVCSPSYLRGRTAPLPLEELQKEHLLELSNPADPLDRWYTWSSWFKTVGAATHVHPRTTDFDNYSLLVSAALGGHGVALCWAGLLDAYLESGALVRASLEAAKSTRGYYASYGASQGPDSVIAQLARMVGGIAGGG